jgi:hypothetical protein
MIPESREVWEHGNREFDRRDALYGRAEIFLVAAAAILLLGLIWMLL